MPVNDTTANRSYQKPNIANTLSDDVGRLRSALDAIDTDMASKAPSAGPTFTGVTTVAAGSAAAPSLTFTGATSDTGLYSPGADQVAISTGGTGRVFVAADGKVGIGVTPSVQLDVRGTDVLLDGGPGNGRLTCGVTGSTVQILSTTTGFSNYQAIKTRALSHEFWVGAAGSNVESLRITSDGKVGIGTSSPTTGAKLHVAVDADGDYALYGLSPGANGLTGLQPDGTNGNVLRWGGVGANAGVLRFISGTNSERARITSDGKVGIGTSAPGYLLDIAGDTRITGTNGLRIEAGSTGTQLYNNAGGTVLDSFTAGTSLRLLTQSTERARIDSSGRLLVGTSASRQTSGVEWQVQTEGTTYTGYSAITNANSAIGSYLILGKSRGTGVGSSTIVQVNDALGTVAFVGANGSNVNLNAAYITCAVDDTPGVGVMPGRLGFFTTPSGSGTPTEAMRINNQRELLIGTTTRTANGGVLQISNGITFPGTQSACSDPNTLDDYEEGTFTPVAAGITTAGTATYSTQTGRYTKVGTMVYFWGAVNWTSGNGTGNLRIGGLPFTAINSNVRVVVDLTTGSTVTPARVAVGDVISGITSFYVYNAPTDGSATTNVTYPATGDCIFSGFYQA